MDGDVQRHGTLRISLSSSLPSHDLSGYEIVCDGSPGSTSCRTIDTASRRDARFAGAASHTIKDPGAR